MIPWNRRTLVFRDSPLKDLTCLKMTKTLIYGHGISLGFENRNPRGSKEISNARSTRISILLSLRDVRAPSFPSEV